MHTSRPAMCTDTTQGSPDKSNKEYTSNLQEQLRISSSQVEQLERENTRLVDQLKEVIKMNTHWQRYDSQREEYVLKLTRSNRELQDKVSKLQRAVEKLDIEKKAEIKKENLKLEERKNKPENAKTWLKCPEGAQATPSSSLRKDEEIAALIDHIAKLKDIIVDLERGKESRLKEDNDELEMLREQVTVCVEDFKQERKDRERISAENEKLRERLAQAERCIMDNETRMYAYDEQKKILQERVNVRPVSNPAPAKGFEYDEPCCYPEDRTHWQTAQEQTRRCRHFGDDLTELPSDVEIDGFQGEPQDEADNGTLPHQQKEDDQRSGVEDIEEDALQCPTCLAYFGNNEHDALLDHINTCTE